jgi:ribosomal protein L39E
MTKKIPNMQNRRYQKRAYQKKIKLSKQNRRTKWAPVWVVMKKLGKGKKAHPSAVTYVKRHWARTKLKIKPRRMRKRHLG